jgi:hypothetical protein
VKRIGKFILWGFITILFLAPILIIYLLIMQFGIKFADTIMVIVLTIWILSYLLLIVNDGFREFIIDTIKFPFLPFSQNKRRLRELEKLKNKKYVKIKTKHNSGG